MQRRCKEGGAGGRGGGGGWLMAKYDFRVRKYCIYTYSFFISVGWLNRFGSVQRFQTLETETERNRNFFMIFLIG